MNSSTNSANSQSIPAFTTTWIENWPLEVQGLSFRQHGLCLSSEQTHALGRRNGVFAHCFAEGFDSSLAELEAALERALLEFPGGAFARLGSRSAKDTPTGILSACRVESGAQVIKLLTDHSRRVAFDLRWSLQHNYRPWIFLREWQDFDWSSELRCFLLQGRLVGISQYHHAAELMTRYSEPQIVALKAAIQQTANSLTAAFGPISMVFDVYLTWNDGPTASLIELNPWGHPTDPCLFSWDEPNFDGSVRFRPASA
jgi:hypothetical protein